MKVGDRMVSKIFERRYLMDDVDQVLEEISQAFSQDKAKYKESSLVRMRSKILVVLNELIAHPGYGKLLEQLRQHDEYTYRHSIGVAFISRWIAETERMSRDEIRSLTQAAILHDVGKLQIPGEILNKPGSLTMEEYYQIRCHSECGYDLLKSVKDEMSDNIEYSERIALVALQHHEREDGSGYPYNLTSERIDRWSKIVAVADVFHAMISNRVYKAPATALQVLKMLNEEKLGALAYDIVTCLQRQAMTLMIGDQIKLSDGSVGRIVMVPSNAPVQPIVEVDGTYIELVKHPELVLDDQVRFFDSTDTYSASSATE